MNEYIFFDFFYSQKGDIATNLALVLTKRDFCFWGLNSERLDKYFPHQLFFFNDIKNIYTYNTGFLKSVRSADFVWRDR